MFEESSQNTKWSGTLHNRGSIFRVQEESPLKEFYV